MVLYPHKIGVIIHVKRLHPGAVFVSCNKPETCPSQTVHILGGYFVPVVVLGCILMHLFSIWESVLLGFRYRDVGHVAIVPVD